MLTTQKIGAAIAGVTALLAAAGLLTGYFRVQPAVGLAVAGILIGAGVARRAFSATPHPTKKNELPRQENGAGRS